MHNLSLWMSVTTVTPSHSHTHAHTCTCTHNSLLRSLAHTPTQVAWVITFTALLLGNPKPTCPWSASVYFPVNSSKANGWGITSSVMLGHCFMSNEHWHSWLFPTANSLLLNLVPFSPLLGALVHTRRWNPFPPFHLLQCGNTIQSPVLSLLLPSSVYGYI